MYLKKILICVLFTLCKHGFSQDRVNINIGDVSAPKDAEVILKLQ